MDNNRHAIAVEARPRGKLSALIAEACALAPPRSEAAAAIAARLDLLSARLSEERLQLAVLGQFKRGKSTLLNALLGKPVLPMAVTPLTAIPTFISASESFHLRATAIAGPIEEFADLNAESLHSLLAARVTEEANPRNRLGLAKVEIGLPSALLERGVVLIDTPGVGSTYRHNTKTAEAILPECDAALFVVSPDPPITQTELEFLTLVRATAPRIVLVLNKIDILDDEDREAAVNFLRRVADETAGLSGVPLYCLSAKEALKAKLAGNQAGLAASGFADFENYLLDFLAREKSVTLQRAVALKATALAGELKFEIEAGLAALRMPAERLSECLAEFGRAAERFEAERNTSSDLIAGDRKRILADLDSDAERLRLRMRDRLASEMDESLNAGTAESRIVADMSERIPTLFQNEFETSEAEIRERITGSLRVHEERVGQLIGRVRRAAAEILAIEYAAPAAAEAFVLKKVPYWVTSARESLRLVPPGALDRFLPKACRRRRARARLAAQLDDVVRRNVENLRWSLRQNLEDGLRAFEASLDAQLRLTVGATREALKRGLRQRAEGLADAEAETDMLERAARRISEIADALNALHAN